MNKLEDGKKIVMVEAAKVNTVLQIMDYMNEYTEVLRGAWIT